VDLLPNRGAVVRSITVQEVREVCQVRRVLECEATRSACSQIDADALEAMALEMRTLAVAEQGPANASLARELDNRFHDLISTACENTLLAREIGRLKLLFRAYRDTAWDRVAAKNDYRRLPMEAAEHLAIVECLLARDASAAARAMASHIRSGERYWVRHMTAGISTIKKGRS